MHVDTRVWYEKKALLEDGFVILRCDWSAQECPATERGNVIGSDVETGVVVLVYGSLRILPQVMSFMIESEHICYRYICFGNEQRTV